jgi:cell wall assembly regulator SMI1
MNEHERTVAAWQRIKQALGELLPEAVDNLQGPVSEDRLKEVESELGVRFPEALRVSLMLHNGDGDESVTGAMPDCHRYLPVEEIRATWRMGKELSASMDGTADTPEHWRALVEDGIIFVNGPVKPLAGSDKWIPFSDMEGAVQRYVDFDQAPGGTPGQVIEIDPEGCSYEVIAPSFLAFLESYAAGLEQGLFHVMDDCVQRRDHGKLDEATGDATQEMPDYLQQTAYEPYDSRERSENRSPSEIDANEIVTVVGSMGFLMGGPETIFSLVTEQGREYTFLAKPDVTEKYGTIAIRQAARVKARRYSRDVSSVFVDSMKTEQPDFVALAYTMLRL